MPKIFPPDLILHVNGPDPIRWLRKFFPSSLANVVPLPSKLSRRSLAQVVRGLGSGGVKPVLQSALTTGKKIGVSLGAVHVRLTGSAEMVPAKKYALAVKLPSHRFPPEYEPSSGLGLTETTQFHQLAVSDRKPWLAESPPLGGEPV